MNNLDVESIYLQYLGLGESRTIAKLATLTGRSKDSLYKLAQRHNWSERLQKDSEALKSSFKLSDIENMGAGELLAVINRKTLDKLAISVHTIEPKTIKDAKLLLEIHSLISLKPTVIKQETEPDYGENNTKVNTGAFIDLLKSILTKEQMREFDSRVAALARES